MADAPWESPKEALYLAHSIRDSLIGGNSLKTQREAVRHRALGIIDRMLGSAAGELKRLQQEFSDPRMTYPSRSKMRQEAIHKCIDATAHQVYFACDAFDNFEDNRNAQPKSYHR